AAASDLMMSSAWEVSDPIDTQGNRLTQSGITTMTVQRPEKSNVQPDPIPIYFQGTFNGEIWRGSPEVGWTKVCSCSDSLVRSIATDVVHVDRIVAIFGSVRSPGRIKELTGITANGAANIVDMDKSFQFPVQIQDVTSVAIDPADSNIVF